MSSDRRQGDDVFGARLGNLLRTTERVGDDFEKDLVAAIRSDSPIEREPTRRSLPNEPAWWLTPMTIRVSPVVAFALAASILAIVAIGAIHRPSPLPPAPSAVATRVVHDTVSVVRFVFVGDAKSVALVGDFNAWGAEPVSMTRTGPSGAWAVSVPLVNGRHEYAFIVDGKRWVADPFAPTSSDEFNTNSSIITVGT